MASSSATAAKEPAGLEHACGVITRLLEDANDPAWKDEQATRTGSHLLNKYIGPEAQTRRRRLRYAARRHWCNCLQTFALTFSQTS